MNSNSWVQKTHLFRKDEYICAACRSVCDKPYQICPVCGEEKTEVVYESSWVDEAEEMSIMLDDDW